MCLIEADVSWKPNEENYDGAVKAQVFLLGNGCGVSHGKIRELLLELMDDKIEISDGIINGLCAEFPAKTGQEKTEIFKKLVSFPVMNVDFTMLHYRNGLSENESLSPVIVIEFEWKYDRMLEIAEKEYTEEPPGDYYREGYNLCLRLRKCEIISENRPENC